MQPPVLRHASQAAFDLLLDLEEVVARKTVRLSVGSVLSTHPTDDDGWRHPTTPPLLCISLSLWPDSSQGQQAPFVHPPCSELASVSERRSAKRMRFRNGSRMKNSLSPQGLASSGDCTAWVGTYC